MQKECQKSFFYCRDTSLGGEPPLPGLREERLVYSSILNSRPDREYKKKLKPVLHWINSLLFHGLSVVALARCWVGWQIQPLSIRPRLMCEYSSPRDDMRFSQVILEPNEVTRSRKRILGEPISVINQVGLNPFWRRNRALEVTHIYFCYL